MWCTELLTDWLRSDLLETTRRLNAKLTGGGSAYRLASIGFVGNQDQAIQKFPFFNGLPIGFDRIGWKLPSDVSSEINNWAYRLASIGLVENLISHRIFPTFFGVGLPIGFDRISWKLCWYNLPLCIVPGLPIGFDRISWKHLIADCNNSLPFNDYRLASIGLVENANW